jgi:acyl-CoA reductase-like NAD-dependent aldehyde dehydrogenase
MDADVFVRNAPFILGFRAVSYALAVGNTCVLKGSETSPRCHLAIGSIFKEAGLPDGVLNILFHRPQDAAEITTALIEHPAVKKVNFTGSTAVGSIIAATAGKNLKPVLMELGGKASAIVCEDADIQKAAVQCAIGAFLHASTHITRICSKYSLANSHCVERANLYVY